MTKDFKLESLTQSAQYKAVGNAVHLGVAKTVAKAIKQAISAQSPITVYNTNLCVCGTILEGRKKSCSPKCRKRKTLFEDKTSQAYSKAVETAIMSREEKLSILESISKGTRNPNMERIKAIEVHNKMQGDNAPDKVDAKFDLGFSELIEVLL